MFLHTETVVYIYIGVCSCMLLFNIALMLIRRSEGKVRERYVGYYSRILKELLQYTAPELDDKRMKQLILRLRIVGQLRSFHMAVMTLTEQDKQQAARVLALCKPVFISLAPLYMQKDAMYQAYFAYLMSVYKICNVAEDNKIVDMMRRLIRSDSAYCRENALKALYSFGNEKNVYYAMKTMNDNMIFHHSKLITDGLLTFSGNQKLLAFMFYSHLAEFNIEFQISFINYIRTVSGAYKDKFYQILQRADTDKEIKIAMVRYYARYPYKPMKALLIEYITKADATEWELAAVAASVLREYSGQDVVDTLMQALLHTNWYIRYNAAESLHYKNISFQELAAIYNGDNRYAREMLEYQRQKSQINQQIEEKKVVL